MKYKVKNGSAPLYHQIDATKRSIALSPKEEINLSKEDFESSDIQNLIRRGNLSLVKSFWGENKWLLI